MPEQHLLKAAPRAASFDDLLDWIDGALAAPVDQKETLKRCIAAVLDDQRERGHRDRLEAIDALAGGFARKVAQLHSEIAAKEQTVSTLTRYFEDVVRDLSEKARRDPKTQLMNFVAFEEYLTTFLATEQRGFWCGVGIVDAHDFKRVNDTLGHAMGDVVLQGIARLLAEQTRSADRLAMDGRPADFHARFGGDEFAFLLTSLRDPGAGARVADRFRRAVEQHDWSTVHEKLAPGSIRVDVGLVCLELGPAEGRRRFSTAVGQQLLRIADDLMYQAKNDPSHRVHVRTMQAVEGQLMPLER